MPYQVTEFETTPNPNAVKVWLDQSLSDRPLSFLNRDHAEKNPVAARLFALPGVTSVLINGRWLTVNKEEGESWKKLRKALRETLAEL
jgi:hypothetical protein